MLLSALINVLDVISIYKQKLKPSYSHSIYLLRLELEPEEHPDQLYPYLKIINKNCISNLKHTEISQNVVGTHHKSRICSYTEWRNLSVSN